jgi:hypothetical protein
MPKYRKKDGTIVSFTKPVPKITQRMLGLRPARKTITVKDIEMAGKRRKQAGGMVKTPKKKLATGGFKDAFGMGVGRIKKSAGALKKAVKPRQKFVGRKAQTMRKKMAK